MASLVVEIPADLAPVIRRLPVVNYLEADTRGQLSQTFSTQDTSWGVHAIRAPQAWSPGGFRGDGVNIVFLDSGADSTHRYSIHQDGPANMNLNCYYVQPFTSCKDTDGHGTHVSGIAAARDNDVGFIGVAHEVATTSMVKMCVPVQCNDQMLIDALDWVATNGRTRQVVNMSLTWCAMHSDRYQAIVRAQNSGALLIGAAGNSNGCAGASVVYPAKYDEVVAVAGTLPGDVFASAGSPLIPAACNLYVGSATGPEVEVSAPYYATSMVLNGAYGTKCGTSMAAPVATGVAALIWGKNPTWTAGQVRNRLRASVVDLGTSGRDAQFGYGRVDAVFAVSNQPLLSGSSISGPTAVYEHDVGSWTATAIGGFPAYSYTWDVIVNGMSVHSASGSSMMYTNRGYSLDGPQFTVSVTVRDTTGATRTSASFVSVELCDGSQGPC